MPIWLAIRITFAVGAVFGFLIAALLMADERSADRNADKRWFNAQRRWKSVGCVGIYVFIYVFYFSFMFL